MEILTGQRQSGKTTYLIKQSAEGKGTIIAPTSAMAQHIMDQAKEMNLTIPKPISWTRFVNEYRGKKGPFLLDELGIALDLMSITTATLDASCAKDLRQEEDNEMASWAAKEIELAIASEKAASEGTGDWQYGAGCYESALRAFRSLCRDGHSGMSIQITKSILSRLVDGKCLTPIEDTEDGWNDITWTKDGVTEYQCKRMSSLFKKVSADGEVTYSDINRVSCVDINSPDIAYHNGFATRLIDKIFPITMPYLAPAKPFRLFTEEFLVDQKNGDFDTTAYLYILMPDGKKIELNRYFKEEDGQMVQIEKEEYEERKAKRVDKK